MSDFEQIDKTIQSNLNAFKKPGALTVRPGYKIKDGWITKQPAIVVTVQRKTANVAPQELIPANVGGYPTDVREATTIQKLRQAAPQRHAALMATVRPEYAQPEFTLERDAQTGELLQSPAPMEAVAKQQKKSGPTYQPPQNCPLTPVDDTMTIICHAGPDAAWLELSAFLKDVKNQLTVGMYDFTSAHVLQGVQAGLSGASKPKLSLVLDHPAPNRTANQSDEQTQAALAKALGKREQFAWAAEAHDPKVNQAFFPNAYHIKVAVKDHASFWLSSGNWNNSNQADIDPFAAGANMTQIDATANKADRDWDVIVQHAGLAKTFETYLQNDLTTALPFQIKATAATADAHSLLATLGESPEMDIRGKAVTRKYFPAKSITKKVKVQPLLTPDQGAGNYATNILKLVESAQHTLDIQTQYIHPPKAGTDQAFQALITAVQAKVKSGVKVRVILSEYEATGGWLEKLQESGLDTTVVRIQQGVHNKGFVIDAAVVQSATVAVGSQNWSGDGVLRNRDASLIIWDADAAQYFEQIFDWDWNNLAKQKLTSEVSSRDFVSPQREEVAAD